MVQRFVTSLQSERTCNMLKQLWQEIMKISTDLDIEPTRKKMVKWKQNHTNPSVTDYYRVG